MPVCPETSLLGSRLFQHVPGARPLRRVPHAAGVVGALGHTLTQVSPWAPGVGSSPKMRGAMLPSPADVRGGRLRHKDPSLTSTTASSTTLCPTHPPLPRTGTLGRRVSEGPAASPLHSSARLPAAQDPVPAPPVPGTGLALLAGFRKATVHPVGLSLWARQGQEFTV